LGNDAATTESSEVTAVSLDERALAALKERLRWRYPYTIASRQPAKTSVSALQRDMGRDPAEHWRGAWPSSSVSAAGQTAEGLDAPARGVAHHTFLEFVSLERVGSLADLEKEAKRLHREGILSDQELQALDLRALAAFWNSDLGQSVLRHKSCLHREMPLTFRLSLAEAQQFQRRVPALESASHPSLTLPPGEGASEEFVVVTGVVDLAVLLPRELWLVDFKTDAVEVGEWKQRAQWYEPQMRLYALALSRICQRPVTHGWLYFLGPQRAFDCGRSLPDSVSNARNRHEDRC
jgi:ATP-dependent helicase/nuclease subunit A